MSELRPIDLDALEDLLEDLEHADPGEDGGHDPALLAAGIDDPEARRLVSDRLVEYRAILQASREALPMQDVPRGVLDAVLEEAGRASAPVARPARPSVWRRLRGTFLIPGLALATTAALVILVIRPGEVGQVAESPSAIEERPAVAELEERAPADEEAPQADRAAQRLADANLERARREEAPDASARGQGLLDTRAPAEARPVDQVIGGAADDEAEAPLRDVELGKVEQQEKKRPVSKSAAPPAEPTKKRSKTSSTDAPAPMPKPAPGASSGPGSDPKGGAKSDSSSPWTEIEVGDAQRRAGKCTIARTTYQKVLAATTGADGEKAQARALAGLGLCEAAGGNQAAADGHFAKARAADPAVGAFIEAELARKRD